MTEGSLLVFKNAVLDLDPLPDGRSHWPGFQRCSGHMIWASTTECFMVAGGGAVSPCRWADQSANPQQQVWKGMQPHPTSTGTLTLFVTSLDCGGPACRAVPDRHTPQLHAMCAASWQMQQPAASCSSTFVVAWNNDENALKTSCILP